MGRNSGCWRGWGRDLHAKKGYNLRRVCGVSVSSNMAGSGGEGRTLCWSLCTHRSRSSAKRTMWQTCAAESSQFFEQVAAVCMGATAHAMQAKPSAQGMELEARTKHQRHWRRSGSKGGAASSGLQRGLAWRRRHAPARCATALKFWEPTVRAQTSQCCAQLSACYL